MSQPEELECVPAKSCSSAHLGDKSDELFEMLCLLIGINFEYLADAIVMIPLLKELFLVGGGVSFN